jgi:hypothetical protein
MRWPEFALLSFSAVFSSRAARCAAIWVRRSDAYPLQGNQCPNSLPRSREPNPKIRKKTREMTSATKNRHMRTDGATQCPIFPPLALFCQLLGRCGSKSCNPDTEVQCLARQSVVEIKQHAVRADIGHAYFVDLP